MISVKPILVNDLFPNLNGNLIKLLSELPEDKWSHETVCKNWDVKDIVGHLFKDYIGLISRKRDKYRNPSVPKTNFNNDQDLLNFINKSNQEWVGVVKNTSPRILIDLLDYTGKQLFDYFNSVDLMANEANVNWIGSKTVPNWMDVAREYTEHWLHQAHIRDAVGAPLLESMELFHPFIASYLLALPKTYRDVNSPIGTTVQISVRGEAGGVWRIEKLQSEWNLLEGNASKPNATVSIDQDILWRLFSKGVTSDKVKDQIKIDGDITLGAYVLNTVSLIA